MIDVAIIGAGAAGAAAAYALTKRGARVCVYDQFEFCGERGSSHGVTRLFRTAYFEHPNYVPILKRARALWRELERAAGDELYFETGVLEAGPKHGPLVSGLRTAIAAHEIAFEEMNAHEATKRFPQFALPEDYAVFLEREAGFLFAEKSVGAMLRLAAQAGAHLHPATKVEDWDALENGVSVKTAQGEARFDRLVIAPGVWANDMLKLPSKLVAPTPKTLFWRRPKTNAFDQHKGFPPFAIETDDGRLFYGFPAIDEHGVKAAEHTSGAAIARPEDEKPDPEPQECAALEEFLSEFIPALAGREGAHKRCRYEMSPDGDFLIDKHPSSDRVSFAAGLSGHGFKFAPALGEALADLALNGETGPEWDFLSLARFS
ncbi:MAG: N-methyl-L-tryptophan oxidase [Parvularculaceae bacterium]